MGCGLAGMVFVIALSIAILLAFSPVGIASADAGNPLAAKYIESVKSKLSASGEGTIAKLGALSIDRLRQLAGANSEQIMAALGEVRPATVSGVALAKRNFSQAQRESGANNLDAAMGDYNKAKDAAAEIRLLVRQMGNRYKACKGSNSTQCADVQSQVLAGAKNFTIASYDRAISFMEALKLQVSGSEYINSTNAREAEAGMGDAIAMLGQGKSEAEAASDIGQVRKALENLNGAISYSNYIAKMESTRVFRARVSEVIAKDMYLEKRMGVLVAAANFSQAEADDLESKLMSFSHSISMAREKMASSLQSFNDATSMKVAAKADNNVSGAESAAIQGRLAYARAYAKEAQSILTQAHITYMEIANDVKQALGARVTVEELVNPSVPSTIAGSTEELEGVDSGE